MNSPAPTTPSATVRSAAGSRGGAGGRGDRGARLGRRGGQKTRRARMEGRLQVQRKTAANRIGHRGTTRRNLTLVLPLPLDRALRFRAFEADLPVSTIVAVALQVYLAGGHPTPPRPSRGSVRHFVTDPAAPIPARGRGQVWCARSPTGFARRRIVSMDAALIARARDVATRGRTEIRAVVEAALQAALTSHAA